MSATEFWLQFGILIAVGATALTPPIGYFCRRYRNRMSDEEWNMLKALHSSKAKKIEIVRSWRDFIFDDIVRPTEIDTVLLINTTSARVFAFQSTEHACRSLAVRGLVTEIEKVTSDDVTSYSLTEEGEVFLRKKSRKIKNRKNTWRTLEVHTTMRRFVRVGNAGMSVGI